MTTSESPSSIIRQAIIDKFTDDPLWPIYTDDFPASCDQGISVYTTSGMMDGRNQRTGEMTEKPGLQIRTRSLSYRAAYKKISSIVTWADKQVHNTTVIVEGAAFLLKAITRQGNILPLGPDVENRRRQNFVVNAIVTIRESQEQLP